MANIAQGAFDDPPQSASTSRAVNERVDAKGQQAISDITGLGNVLQDIRSELRKITAFLEQHSDAELEIEEASQ